VDASSIKIYHDFIEYLKLNKKNFKSNYELLPWRVSFADVNLNIESTKNKKIVWKAMLLTKITSNFQSACCLELVEEECICKFSVTL
jgi:hypothetical protein